MHVNQLGFEKKYMPIIIALLSSDMINKDTGRCVSSELLKAGDSLIVSLSYNIFIIMIT